MAKRIIAKQVIKNFKRMYKQDIKSENGFLITDSEGLRDKQRTEGGIYSPKYGSIWGDQNAFAERYKCECGALMGRIYEGVQCTNCNTVVKFVDNNLMMTGWLKIDDYRLIHPTLYLMLESFMGGPKVFDNIIKIKGKFDTKGIFHQEITTTGKAYDKYFGIGLIQFYEKFDEILEFFKHFNRSKPNKEEVYNFLVENRKNIFIKHFPVYSLLLRPISLSDDSLTYGLVNSKYARLTKKIFTINKTELRSDIKPVKILRNLYEAQTIIEEINTIMIESISQKDGHIRNNMMGSRFNYSSRNVIVPLSGGKTNHIILPYLGFMELYKPEIINTMMKMENITINEATEKWNKATLSFNKKVYEIMKYLIKNTKGGLKVLINRNPTINYGSILCMTVIDVKEDYNDYTMSIPINVLPVLAGDFDGLNKAA